MTPTAIICTKSVQTIVRARQLRAEAEQSDDPEPYEKAAAEFEQLQMYAAADRCRDRAVHYRSEQEVVHADLELHD